ncbi:MAG: ATP-grasp domain-containing protein [Spirochaetaceae bacterium]|nr:ATP-grasp domain-containing protein [Spirochaetaceae bacterium]
MLQAPALKAPVLLIYGLATTDYQWIRSFYPVKRFLEAGAALRIPVEVLLPMDFLRLYKSGSYRNHRILVRGSVPDEVFTALETAGIPHTNTRFCRKICDDKTVTARFLAENNYPAPQTLGILSNSLPTVEADFPYPIIAKPVFGSRGRGVTLLRSSEELHTFTEKLHREGTEDYLLQEYLSYAPGKDLRVFICGGEILAAVERQGQSGSEKSGAVQCILSNSSSGGTVRPVQFSSETDFPQGTCFPQKYRDMALDIAAKAQLPYGTVDFIWKSQTELAVCELNASPGFEELEKQTGIAIAEPLLYFVSSF